ncbi:GNAT family N-acetyltransferase [Chelativorans sp. SCAU2101]|uniref:GNAT family N-acetyltransferase n=1 Tax=Chelativorans petroleitrophicus TaxID=2975484 RepID=A0A9X2XAM4_9HYPH|nr:GNAT family N-acetyltransferase [Chelativorans petroleitrophicus]MCT8991246.1 GNAT family N-acetyltransferase [Chelativorans petroleitrophicus]
MNALAGSETAAIKGREGLKAAGKSWVASVYRDHRPLEAVWRRLEAEGYCTPFQTYDWASCWYETAVAHGLAEPVIAVFSREGGDPAWILPLCLYRKKGLRVISFADLGVTDYAAPVIARDAPRGRREIEGMIRALLGALPSCDLVHFQKLPAEIEGVSNPLLVRRHWRFPANCYGIRLSGPWQEQAEKIMQRRLRSTIRKQKRRIAGKGTVSISEVDRPEALRPALDTLMSMRRTRFEAIGRADMPAAWHEFYYRLATCPKRTLGVSVTTLEVAGEPVATCFGLKRRGAYLAILPSFAMGEWETFRPGMLLFDAMLERHAEETAGEGYFDFTIGDEPYKKRFGGDCLPLYEWMVPRSAIGAAAFLAWRAKGVLRRTPAEPA